jgi:hypothetical protein
VNMWRLQVAAAAAAAAAAMQRVVPVIEQGLKRHVRFRLRLSRCWCGRAWPRIQVLEGGRVGAHLVAAVKHIL